VYPRSDEVTVHTAGRSGHFTREAMTAVRKSVDVWPIMG